MRSDHLTLHRAAIQRPTSRSALVLYGSETGNAQDVAEEIGRLTERHRFDTTVIDLDSIELVRASSLPQSHTF